MNQSINERTSELIWVKFYARASASLDLDPKPLDFQHQAFPFIAARGQLVPPKDFQQKGCQKCMGPPRRARLEALVNSWSPNAFLYPFDWNSSHLSVPHTGLL